MVDGFRVQELGDLLGGYGTLKKRGSLKGSLGITWHRNKGSS